MIDLSVEIAGLLLKNSIMPASGTFGYGKEFMDIDGFDIGKLGAVVTKGITLLPRQGNPQPRTIEVMGGMINRIGLQNPGVEESMRQFPWLVQFPTQVIVNVSGSTIDEYVKVAEKLNDSCVVTALEINISCPNVKQGGISFGQDPNLAAEVARAVRNVTKLPLIFKLTPNVTSVIPIARAVIGEGANAISLVNTFLGRARIWNGGDKGDYIRGQYVEGGVSGACIKPLALRIVSDAYKAGLGVPIIGIGGISSWQDVVEFLESGAVAVQIGTANFIDPLIMMRLPEELSKYIESTGCKSITEWREKNFPMPPIEK